MRRFMKMFVVTVAMVLLAGAVCLGGSLFRKGQEQKARQKPVPGGATIYTSVPAEKPPVPKVHDLVKVVVLKASSASADGKTEGDKNTEFDAAFDKFVKWGGEPLTAGNQPPGVKGSAKYKTGNKAETSKNMQIKATIKAEVAEVLPNGNLVIEAIKTRTVNQETEVISLTGVIDPADLDATGTVLSDDIAQLKLSYTGSGAVSDPQKRGILMRILDWFWPF
jgi:flagellar L-ring protein precursor FlgH